MSTKKDIDYIIGSIQKAVNKYTYPVFTDKNSKPDSIASSVVIEVEGKYYLITASHVVNNIIKGNSLFSIGVEGKIISISGEFICSRSLQSNSKVGDFDIAYIELNSEFVSGNRITILEQSKLVEHDYITSPSISFIHGFPNSKNKQSKALWNAKSFKLKSYAYAGIIDISFNEWDKFGKRRDNHTCMSYGKNITSSTPTHPRGISGGGLWIVPNILKPDEFYLDSIFIEYHKNAKIAFATKISQVITFIKETSLCGVSENIVTLH